VLLAALGATAYFCRSYLGLPAGARTSLSGGSGPAEPSAAPVEPAGSVLDALRRQDILRARLAAAGHGDPARAPAEIVAIVGISNILKRPQAGNEGLAFGPGGRTLALAAPRLGVILWDAATGKGRLVKRLPRARINFVRLSPDGALLAFGAAGRPWLAEVAAPHKPPQQLAAVNWRGSRFVFLSSSRAAIGGVDEPLALWNIPRSGVSQPPTLEGSIRPQTLAVSADGRRLAAGSAVGQFGLVRVWDVASGRVGRTLRRRRPPVVSLALSPDGKLLACAVRTLNTVQIIDLVAGKSLCFFRNHLNNAADVIFSPDGKLVASCAVKEGLVRLWDPRTGEEKRVLKLDPPGGAVLQVLFAPDGRHLATRNSDGTAYIVRLAPLAK
jgi:WD40 repeat protein